METKTCCTAATTKEDDDKLYPGMNPSKGVQACSQIYVLAL